MVSGLENRKKQNKYIKQSTQCELIDSSVTEAVSGYDVLGLITLRSKTNQSTTTRILIG